MSQSTKHFHWFNTPAGAISVGMIVIAAGLVLPGCNQEDAGAKPTSAPIAAPNPNPNPNPNPDVKVVAPTRDVRSTGASRDYGDLYVAPGHVEAYSSVQPWTSYWFPAKDPILWQPRGSDLSPLQKYDLYAAQVHGRTTHAAQWEQNDFTLDDADNWDGLCDAWAAASILIQPEPAAAATLNGIQFNIVDLKALEVKSFQDMNGKKKIYGYKYTQEGIDDFQDMYPDQFQRVLVAELINKGQAFVIDKDPGLEVWNTPISGVMMTIEADEKNAHVMHVSTRLQYAEYSQGDLNAVGTNAYWMDPPYTYDLFGNTEADGRFKVEYGVWTAKSFDVHPDFAAVLPNPNDIQDRKSFNPEIDTALVNEIIQRAQQASATGK